jgi:23S rRNA pseudouridine1911/1915/1917 synthase
MASSVSHLSVGPDAAGKRLDVFLAEALPFFSRSRLQKCIDLKGVQVNGAPVKRRALLREGDRIMLDSSCLDLDRPVPPRPEPIALEVLYEDDYLVAVNKPAGMVVHPGKGNREGTMVNALMHHIGSLSKGYAAGRPGIVHRLDKGTSGVLLVAKTDDAHERLGSMFAGRLVTKEYIGICIGPRPSAHGMIDAPVGRSRREPTKRTVRTGGKESRTEYWLLRHQSGVSVMRFGLHTGRTHQIRVHCRHAGFPIAADPQYGGGKRDVGRLQPLDRPFGHSILACFDRQALHARRIAFRHPCADGPVDVVAPFPSDFGSALSRFGDDVDGTALTERIV